MAPTTCGHFHTLVWPATTGMSDWYENALKRLSSAPANPYIRHSREGGNPRINIPRKNVNRDTTTYVHTATPLRLSGESTSRTPIRRRNPEGCGRCQFSYLGVPAAAGMSDWYESMSRDSDPGWTASAAPCRPLGVLAIPAIASQRTTSTSHPGGSEYRHDAGTPTRLIPHCGTNQMRKTLDEYPVKYAVYSVPTNLGASECS